MAALLVSAAAPLRAQVRAVDPPAGDVAAQDVEPVDGTGVRLLRGAEPAPAAEARASDRWLAEDKLKHFFMSYATTVATYAAVRSAGVDATAGVSLAAAAGVVAGIGKELYDVRSSGPFSVRDLVWDGLGIALGVGLAAAAR